MATQSGQESAPVTEQQLLDILKNKPYTIEFFKAVQLLERVFPDREPVGRFVNPENEVVRFGTPATLGFPASEIQEIIWREGRPPLMVVNFMGLTGPSGILPYVYTVLMIERLWGRDRTLQEFLDIFNHRMASLFYRAWQKYRFTAGFGSAGRERFTQYLMDLGGIGTRGLRNRQEIRDESLLYYAGLLMPQQRSAISLEHLIEDYFEAPVEIEQFVGAWYDLPSSGCCFLIDEERPSRQLGMGAVAGDQIWEQQSRVRIRIGPLTLKKYRGFLPGGAAHSALRALTRFYSGGQVDYEIQLVLDRKEVPACELGVEGEEALPLGWCSWAKTGPFERDPDDAILALGDEKWA
jgi:type VI secretion system protein ImpH